MQDGFGGCAFGKAPTEENLQARTDEINAYLSQDPKAKIQVDTYEAIQATPPAFSWPGQDTGSIFGDLQYWASGVYASYRASSCNTGTTGGPPFYCEVSPSIQDPVNNPRKVTWTAVLHNYGTQRSFTYKWEGTCEDDTCLSGSGAPLVWPFSAGGSKYANLAVTASGGLQAICTKTIELGDPLRADCIGTPSPSLKGSEVLWTAYPKGGSGTYTNYHWSGDIAGSTLDSTEPNFKNTYTSTGTKNLTVKVTDSLGKAATTTCSATVSDFTAYCVSDTSVVQSGNKPVKWTAITSDPSLTYTYLWSGDVDIAAPNKTSNPISVTYSTVGKKQAHVVVTSGGVSVPADCEIAGPACSIDTPAQPTPQNADVPSTLSYSGFSQPISAPSITCGGGAKLDSTPSCGGTDGSCSFTCTKYTGSGTISVTVQNGAGEKASCTAPITVAAEAPKATCSLTPGMATVQQGVRKTFTLGSNNFTSAPSNSAGDIKVKCSDGAVVNNGVVSCASGTTPCDVTCPVYRSTGGKVTATITSGKQSAICTADVTVTPPSKKNKLCEILPLSQTITSPPGRANLTMNLIGFDEVPANSISITCEGASQTAGSVDYASCTNIASGVSCPVICSTYVNNTSAQQSHPVTGTVVGAGSPCTQASVLVNPRSGTGGTPSPSPSSSPSPAPNLSGDNLVSIAIDTVPSEKRKYLKGLSPAEQIDLAITVTRKPGSTVDTVAFDLVREAMVSGKQVVRLVSSGPVPIVGKAWMDNKVTFTKADLPQLTEPVDPIATGIYTYYTKVLGIYNASGTTLIDPQLQDNVASVSVAIRVEKKAAVPELPIGFALLVGIGVIGIIARMRR